MSDDRRPSPTRSSGASPSGDEGDPSGGQVAARVDHRVTCRAVESADDEPAPHGGTPHEVAGSPVWSPGDLEGDGSPGTSNEATKNLPP